MIQLADANFLFKISITGLLKYQAAKCNSTASS